MHRQKLCQRYAHIAPLFSIDLFTHNQILPFRNTILFHFLLKFYHSVVILSISSLNYYYFYHYFIYNMCVFCTLHVFLLFIDYITLMRSHFLLLSPAQIHILYAQNELFSSSLSSTSGFEPVFLSHPSHLLTCCFTIYVVCLQELLYIINLSIS